MFHYTSCTILNRKIMEKLCCGIFSLLRRMIVGIGMASIPKPDRHTIQLHVLGSYALRGCTFECNVSSVLMLLTRQEKDNRQKEVNLLGISGKPVSHGKSIQPEAPVSGFRAGLFMTISTSPVSTRMLTRHPVFETPSLTRTAKFKQDRSKWTVRCCCLGGRHHSRRWTDFGHRSRGVQRLRFLIFVSPWLWSQ